MRLLLLAGLAVAALACTPALDMAHVHAEDEGTGVTVDFDASGNVFLCGRHFAWWTSNGLETAGGVLFAVDHDYLVVKGQRTLRIEVDEIFDVAAAPTPKVMFRVNADGDVLERDGKRVAKVRSAAGRPRAVLAAFAAVKNAAVLRGVAQVLTLGHDDSCGPPRSR